MQRQLFAHYVIKRQQKILIRFLCFAFISVIRRLRPLPPDFVSLRMCFYYYSPSEIYNYVTNVLVLLREAFFFFLIYIIVNTYIFFFAFPNQ